VIYKTITGPSSDVVTVSEAQEHCVAPDSDPFYMQSLIRSALRSAESFIDGFIAQRQVEWYLPGFASKSISIPLSPIISVDSVSYLDAAGDDQSLSEDVDYWIQQYAPVPSLVAVKEWPETLDGHPAAVTVRLTAGYADDASVPEDIKHAILLRVAELFENREESISGVSNTSTQNAMESLLARYRRMGL